MGYTFDQSVQPFEFVLDGIDFGPHLSSFKASAGISTIEHPYLWSGDFELAYTQDSSDLTEADFSELDTPARWRDGLHPVTLTIDGYTALVLRIKDYRYSQGRGKGSLVQVAELAQFERPSEDVPEIKAGGGTLLHDAIKILIQKGLSDVSPVPTINPGFTTDEKLDVDLVTSSPIDEAQKLAGVLWRWVYVDASEAIRTVKRPIKATTPLFRRSASEVILDPNEGAIHFAADKVIVSGSCQVARRYNDADKCDNPGSPPPAPYSDGVDSQGRARRTVTVTTDAAGSVFPSLGQDTTPITAERKTIYYRYGDSEDVRWELPSQVLDEVRLCKQIQGQASECICTVTTSEQPAGLIFPALGTNTELHYAEILIEAADRKVRFVPFGTKFSSAGSNFELTLDKKELLTSGLAQPNRIQLTSIDPETGEKARLECKKKPEKRQKASTYSLETQTFKGEQKLQPVGWNTFLPKTHRENAGFLPSQKAADYLAKAIALREAGRRDGLLVSMPVPIEWLAAGCPPFAVVHIYKHALLIDEPIISLEQDKMLFSFTGERLGAITEVAAPAPAPVWIPVSGLSVVPVAQTVAMVGSVINPVQLQAFSGVEPYTFSASGAPDGITVSASGLVSGTPTTAGAGNFTVTVTDASATATLTIAYNYQTESMVSPVVLEVSELEADLVLEVEVVNTIPLDPVQHDLVLEIEAFTQPPAIAVIDLVLDALGLRDNPPAGLVSHWTLDDSSWADMVGGNNLSQTQPTVTVGTGAIDGCASFDNGRLESSATALHVGNSHWKLTFQLYLPDTASAYGIAAGSAWRAGLDGSGHLEFTMLDSEGGYAADVVSAGTLTAATWQQIELEFVPGTSISVAINGTTTTATPSYAHDATNTSPFALGYGTGGYTMPTGTLIDDVKFYKF